MRLAPEVTFVALANGVSVRPVAGSNTVELSSAAGSPVSTLLTSCCRRAVKGSARCLYSAEFFAGATASAGCTLIWRACSTCSMIACAVRCWVALSGRRTGVEHCAPP